MKLEFSALSDVGRQRPNNEDTVAVDPPHGLAVLADGMGGYQAGEVASALAVASISDELGRWLDQAGPAAGLPDVRRALAACVENANRKILDAARADAQCAGMGTTLVLAAARGATLLVGHIGDSRAYRWRAGKLAQLTHDHSVLQEQIDAGALTPQEAALLHCGLVTRALGVEATVQLDVQEAPMEPGDVYLLCSDGLTEMLDDADIASALERTQPLDALARRLIDMANEAGGCDNVSVALIKVGT